MNASAAVAPRVSSTPAPNASAAFAPKEAGPWLFGRDVDLAVFGGSALAAFALLGLGAAFGWLDREVSPVVWLLCIVAVDVAHVWSTAFRVYLDGPELRARPLLYLGLPVLCYGVGVVTYAFSAQTFWRALAYVAVYHFVRQQYGWVALYRRRAHERARLDHLLDTTTIYSATLYPILYWHAHLPRRFDWFVEGDFVPLAAKTLSGVLAPIYWGVLAAFLARQGYLLARGRAVNAGKVLVVITTWACWYVGIVALDSDFAFTVTNVLIHGVPYLALTYRWGRARATTETATLGARVLRAGALGFLGLVIALAFTEELLWDRLVWHDHAHIFGQGMTLSDIGLTWLVPLLALPQAVHYTLDGFVWRGKALDQGGLQG